MKATCQRCGFETSDPAEGFRGLTLVSQGGWCCERCIVALGFANEYLAKLGYEAPAARSHHRKGRVRLS